LGTAGCGATAKTVRHSRRKKIVRGGTYSFLEDSYIALPALEEEGEQGGAKTAKMRGQELNRIGVSGESQKGDKGRRSVWRIRGARQYRNPTKLGEGGKQGGFEGKNSSDSRSLARRRYLTLPIQGEAEKEWARWGGLQRLRESPRPGGRAFRGKNGEAKQTVISIRNSNE